MKKRWIWCLCILLLFVWGTIPPKKQALPEKNSDLVLIHGFNNRHQWGEAFLNTLVAHWKSGHIYVLYTNRSDRVWTMRINGKIVTFAGENDHQAGNGSIDAQAKIAAHKIDLLQAKYGLDPRFAVIAHSMGGLVARELVYLRPGRVADLVTIASPHHGTPLAREYSWLGMFVHGQAAMADLTPEAVARFNQKYPVQGSSFAKGGHLFTIAGDADGWGNRGWHGELAVGWTLLALKYGSDSDGVVRDGEATIKGAIHVKTFPDDDHLQLIQKPEVAETISSILP
ncbi:alpha/beta hydrolase [Thermoactinomyces daqus]|uniref:Alpha/beta hydrolase n=1 Tax=Thermoactinomyces daqus TaxID=1329516 RepID=A0A7W1X8E7_9BACL|nr:alpha/beta fold hydrolase [Thermoactinomyces daqus]MBA4541946.1 alpha/beta hydrolase [Thermoactinomyces daqus]